MATQPFNWSEYERVARELSTHADECYLRTSISRAYYYIFHLGRKRVEENGFPLFKPDAHKQIWEKFSESPDFRCRKLAETAKRLKEKRESADYNPFYPYIAKDAPTVVALAVQFATDLANLDPVLPRNTGVQRIH
jgi:hypothetical protein